jgi:hypothetical protein
LDWFTTAACSRPAETFPHAELEHAYYRQNPALAEAGLSS